MLPRTRCKLLLALSFTAVSTTALASDTCLLPARNSTTTCAHRGESSTMSIPSAAFYHEYHGHTDAHLRILLELSQSLPPVPSPSSSHAPAHLPRVFLAGDSSLDNKYWLLGHGKLPAVNHYERVFDPPLCVPDVAYWMNALGQGTYFCINTAVEESTLGERGMGKLKPQDRFIRDNLDASDVLVVSVGGNDIALRPTLGTIACMTWLVKFASEKSIQDGTAYGLDHFVQMFRNDVRDYIACLTSNQRPALVIVNMIYFPDMRGQSWADTSLSLLGYNEKPQKLQLLIKKVFELATSKITLEGTKVVAFPLYSILDGNNSEDYVQRVEPSVSGGQKMASAFLDIIHRELGTSSSSTL